MTQNLFPQLSHMYFPDPQTHDFPEWVQVGDYLYHAVDVVAFGTPLTPETVAEAYKKGIFPWYMRRVPLPWYCPEQRAILEFDELHISRSLKRAQQKAPFTFTIDKDFRSVIESCAAAKHPDQAGTWITQEFIAVYCELHDRGMAHSIEAWNAKGKLVGGLYGIDAGGVFCGESMFFIEANASKLALLFMIDHMRARGANWLDAQVMTPHMEALGAREIDRSDFLVRLEKTQKLGLEIF